MIIPVVLFLIFLTLKLTDLIEWSWFWVSSPLIFAGGLAVVMYTGVVIGFFATRKRIKNIKKSFDKEW